LKKVSAIFLILLFLFDIFGYMAMFEYMQSEAGTLLEARLDRNQYDDSQLMEIKIAVNVPYQTSRSEFERVDGEVELNGTIYKYVKRRVVNDTIYLMCIPHTRKMHLELVKNDLFRMANGLLQNNNSQSTDNSGFSIKVIQSPFDDYITEYHIERPDMFITPDWANNELDALPIPPHFSLDQPPDVVIA